MAFTKVVGAGIHTLSNIASHNINSSGIITATKFVGPMEGDITAVDGTFTGNVTIGGTLTYEDVKNVDAIGFSTFREGLRIPDSKKILLGNLTAGDCQILHDGDDTFIQNKTGDLKIANNVAGDVGGDIYIQAMNGEDSIKAVHDGQVELSFNGNKKFETTGNGISVTGIGTFSGNIIGGGEIQALTKFESKSGNDLRLNAGSANRDIFLQVNDSTLMTVQGSTSNVGIGSETPNAKLRIHNGSDDSAIVWLSGADVYSEYLSLGIQQGKAVLRGGGTGSTNCALSFETSDSGTEGERMILDANGILKLGTSLGASHVGDVPEEIKFFLNSGRGSYGGLSSNAVIFDNQTAAVDAGGTLTLAGFTGSGAIAKAAIRGGNEGSASTNNGYFTIFTRPTSGSLTERIRFTSDGKTFIHGGGATGTNNTSTLLPNGYTLNIHGTSSNDGISVVRYNASYGAYGLNIGKSNNSTFGTNTLVTDNEELGHISFYGADGTDFNMAAQITGEVDGTPSDGTDMPGALVFKTSAEASATPTERLRIKSDGKIKFATSDSSTDYLEYGSNPRLWLRCPSNMNGLRIDASTTPLEIRNSDATGRTISIGGAPNFDMSMGGDYSLSAGEYDSSPTLFFNATRHNGTNTSTSFQTSIKAVATSNTNNTGYLGLGASASPDDLVILTSGIIGIGNTVPEGKGIDVKHDRTNTYSTTSDTRNLAQIIARNGSDAPNRFAAISLVNGGATQAEGSINLVQTGNYTGDLTFKLRTEVSAWAEALRIRSNGNLGINHQQPSAGLHIKTQGRNFSQREFYDGYKSENGLGGDSNSIVGSQAGERTHSLMLESNTTRGKDIGSSIGFRAASGDTLIDVTYAAIVGAKENDTYDASPSTTYDNQAKGFLAFYTSYEYAFNPHYGTRNIERLRITSGGDVVLGHSAANARLHIASGTNSAVGDATNPAFQIGAAANYRFAIHTTNEQGIIANKNGDDGIAFHTKTGSTDGNFGEAARIDASGNVGIGEDNPTSKLLVRDDYDTETVILKLRNYKSGVNTKPTLRFEAATANGQGASSDIQGLAGTDAGGANAANESGMKFIVRHGGSGTEREAFSILKDGNIYFPNGQGIDFGATEGSSKSSTLFHDYEEGLWTPTVTQGIDGTGTFSIVRGWYIKVGDLVQISFFVRFVNNATGSTGNGNHFKMGGLPYAAANLSPAYSSGGVVTYTNCYFNNSNTIVFSIYNNTTVMEFHSARASAANLGGDVNSNRDIYGVGTYRSA